MPQGPYYFSSFCALVINISKQFIAINQIMKPTSRHSEPVALGLLEIWVSGAVAWFTQLAIQPWELNIKGRRAAGCEHYQTPLKLRVGTSP